MRLDKLVLLRGLAPSRERAQALILAGRVLVNEQKVDKCGAGVDDEAAIRLLGDDQPFVSRGGLKLARALEHWHVDVRGKVCLDIGASTGGFTDCLLQNGAAQVIAVDTGYGQFDAILRQGCACQAAGKDQRALPYAAAALGCVYPGGHRPRCHGRVFHLCYTRSPSSAELRACQRVAGGIPPHCAGETAVRSRT